MGMPANPAACGICPEGEENKNKGLLGAREARGARRTGHGGGQPLRKHAEAHSILPPGRLSGGVALTEGGHRLFGGGGVLRSCGTQPPVPHTPPSTTVTPAQEVRASPRLALELMHPSGKGTSGARAACSGRGPACSSCSPCMRARAPAAAYPALPAQPSWTWNAASGWCWALSWEAAELKGRETAFCISCPGTYEEWPDAGATSSPQPGSPRTRGMRSRTAAGSY